MSVERYSIAGLWSVAWLLAVGAIMSTGGCSPAPVTAPTAFAEYNHKTGTFACEYPQGWEQDGGGNRGQLWAKFKSGPAEIGVRANATGSLLGDIMGGRNDSELPPELQAAHKVHELGAKGLEGEYPGYKEVGQPQMLEVSLGPARVSEFTYQTTFGSGMHGYRATVLGHDKGVSVFCICPESDWKTLEPAFKKMLASLTRGQSER
jgi:hypothetical protein